MIQMANGLEMSLAKQYLMIDLFLSNNRMSSSFSRSQKKVKSQITHKGIFNY